MKYLKKYSFNLSTGSLNNSTHLCRKLLILLFDYSIDILNWNCLYVVNLIKQIKDQRCICTSLRHTYFWNIINLLDTILFKTN